MTAQRTLIMTGASRGLGHQAALHLLRAYPEVHLIVTSRGGQPGALAAELTATTSSPNVSEIPCDLGSLASVARAADSAATMCSTGQLPPLQGLLANAGAQFTSATRTTEDGSEMTFGVNVIANFLMIRSLADRMTVPARIVITTSDTHFGDFRHNMGMVPGPQWLTADSLASPGEGPLAETAKAGGVAYSTSKLAVIYLVHALSRRLPRELDVYSFNPGLVPGTGLARDRNALSRAAWRSIMPIISLTPYAVSARRAGRLLADAAAGLRPGESGAYIDRGHPQDSSPESYNQSREEQLWELAERLCGPATTTPPVKPV